MVENVDKMQSAEDAARTALSSDPNKLWGAQKQLYVLGGRASPPDGQNVDSTIADIYQTFAKFKVGAEASTGFLSQISKLAINNPSVQESELSHVEGKADRIRDLANAQNFVAQDATQNIARAIGTEGVKQLQNSLNVLGYAQGATTGELDYGQLTALQKFVVDDKKAGGTSLNADLTNKDNLTALQTRLSEEAQRRNLQDKLGAAPAATTPVTTPAPETSSLPAAGSLKTKFSAEAKQPPQGDKDLQAKIAAQAEGDPKAVQTMLISLHDQIEKHTAKPEDIKQFQNMLVGLGGTLPKYGVDGVALMGKGDGIDDGKLGGETGAAYKAVMAALAPKADAQAKAETVVAASASTTAAPAPATTTTTAAPTTNTPAPAAATTPASTAPASGQTGTLPDLPLPARPPITLPNLDTPLAATPSTPVTTRPATIDDANRYLAQLVNNPRFVHDNGLFDAHARDHGKEGTAFLETPDGKFAGRYKVTHDDNGVQLQLEHVYDKNDPHTDHKGKTEGDRYADDVKHAKDEEAKWFEKHGGQESRQDPRSVTTPSTMGNIYSDAPSGGGLHVDIEAGRIREPHRHQIGEWLPNPTGGRPSFYVPSSQVAEFKHGYEPGGWQRGSCGNQFNPCARGAVVADLNIGGLNINFGGLFGGGRPPAEERPSHHEERPRGGPSHGRR